jgi:hypothetical protein
MKQKTNKLAQFKQWILSIVMPRFSPECENSKRLKSLFLTYFDGGFGVDAEPNTANTFAMGVCKLEYKDEQNELIVYLRRPRLLIGKGGRTIDALTKQLDCKIGIIEVNLQK